MKKLIESIEFVTTEGEKKSVCLNDRWQMYEAFGSLTTKKYSSEALIDWCNNQLSFLRNCIENVTAAKKVAECMFVGSLTKEQLENILALMADKAELKSE